MRADRARERRTGDVLRALVVAALVVAVTSSTGAGVDVRASRQLQTPTLHGLHYAGGPVTDSLTTLSPRAARTLLAGRRSYRTSAGEKVNLGISPSYSFDAAQIQAWVDFVGSLLHGDELENVLIYLAPPAEVAVWCLGAAACYATVIPPTIVAPGEDLDGGLTAEAVLAHEYGHHVAYSRPNPPWGALAYGTKRWASYVNVCAAVLAGQFFPGDQGEHYRLNPAEGFAEAYRVANQRRLGVVEAPWRIVDERFYPDTTATALIEQDVVEPWTEPGKVVRRGRFTRSGPGRHTFSVSTELDGIASAIVRAPKGATFRVTQAMATVCGQRTTYFTVRRVRGYGRFVLVVTRP